MSYEELENKIDQTFVAVRYNVEIEGPAIKPEEDPDVVNIIPTEEPYRAIALAVLYEDRDASLTNVQKALADGTSPIDIINKGLMKGIDAVSLLYTKGFYFLPDLMLAGDGMMEGVKEC